MNTLVFDIETGPLPWEQIAPMYVPPAPLPPWDESSVKCGGLGEVKKAEKIAAAKAAYDLAAANEIAARDAHKCEWASKAALSPLTGQVLAVGIQKADKIVIVGDSGEAEPEILSIFWDVYKKYHANQGRIVGWNSNGFDVPFMVRRSWWHSVPVPESILDKNSRYLCSTFFDLMKFWTVGNSGYEKLDTVARWAGIGGKPEGVNGGHFAALWNSGDPASRQAALDYLKNDLAMTWKLAERMGVIL